MTLASSSVNTLADRSRLPAALAAPMAASLERKGAITVRSTLDVSNLRDTYGMMLNLNVLVATSTIGTTLEAFWHENVYKCPSR